jgi:deazaflavin-dependent oxidoreductase (nitroreductase family)
MRRVNRVNKVARQILRSPLHRVLSKRLMLISVTGRKTGKIYTTPVAYAQDGDHLLIAAGGRWRENLSARPQVTVVLRGRSSSYRASPGLDNRRVLMVTGQQSHPISLRRYRAIAIVMGIVAASLVVTSLLHLTGSVRGHAEPYNPTGAGIAEAVVGIALIWGATSITGSPQTGRPVALARSAFALAGFIVGLTFTVQGGDLPDVTHHSTVLPLLVVIVVLLLRTKSPAPR